MIKDFFLSIKKLKLSVIQWILFVYGLIYIIVMIPAVVDPFTPMNLINNSAYFLYIAGFYVSWSSKLAAGIIFIIWWGIKWYIGLTFSNAIAVILGIPVFLIGLLLIISWAKKKEINF